MVNTRLKTIAFELDLFLSFPFRTRPGPRPTQLVLPAPPPPPLRVVASVHSFFAPSPWDSTCTSMIHFSLWMSPSENVLIPRASRSTEGSTSGFPAP